MLRSIWNQSSGDASLAWPFYYFMKYYISIQLPSAKRSEISRKDPLPINHCCNLHGTSLQGKTHSFIELSLQ